MGLFSPIFLHPIIGPYIPWGPLFEKICTMPCTMNRRQYHLPLLCTLISKKIKSIQWIFTALVFIAKIWIPCTIAVLIFVPETQFYKESLKRKILLLTKCIVASLWRMGWWHRTSFWCCWKVYSLTFYLKRG